MARSRRRYGSGRAPGRKIKPTRFDRWRVLIKKYRRKLPRLLDHPRLALFLTLIFAALAFSRSLGVTFSWILLGLAWIVATTGLSNVKLVKRRPWRIVLLGAVWLAVLGAFGLWLVPKAVPEYTGFIGPKPRTLFSFKGDGAFPILEIGDSGTKFFYGGPETEAMLKIGEDTELKIEAIGGEIKVSTQIRDQSGELIAELIRNEWVTPLSPRAWDRNYNRDALEVKNAKGQVVLQVKVLPDRVQLQGEWWSTNGVGLRLVKNQNPIEGGAFLEPLTAGRPSTPLNIEPMFVYPSKTHLGELRRD